MVRYIKCPRCELNYIDGEKQSYCDVCVKEMKGLKTDAEELEEEEENELPTELCPVCGENMMRAGEKMCEDCRMKAEIEDNEPDPEEDNEWRNYLDDDIKDADSEIVEQDGLFAEFADEIDDVEEEEEFENTEEEDLEYVTGDEIYTLTGDEDDEDDDRQDDDDF